MPTGTCRLCGCHGELTYEHVPPRSAFNKTTRFKIIPYIDYLKAHDPFSVKFKGRVHQGGIGFYSLCSQCNSFLGAKYVPTYTKYSNTFIELAKRKESNFFEIVMDDFQPAKVIKQIVAMFLSVNDEDFSLQNRKLRDYLLDEDSKSLPSRFRVFTYLNTEGQFRHLPIQVKGNFNTGTTVIASEIAYPPLGHVMTIDFQGSLPFHQEITHFKEFQLEQFTSLELSVFRLPTHLSMLLDYRDKQSINDALAAFK